MKWVLNLQIEDILNCATLNVTEDSEESVIC